MICDSSPLIFLSKINELYLLKKIFTKIIIPSSVREEVLVENKAGVQAINDAIKNRWIIIKNPKKEIDFGVGRGENAAINLARERKEKLIIDDLAGVKIAQSFNVDTLRTTSVIILAVSKKILTKKIALNLINKLIGRGYYISSKHYAGLIARLV